MASYWCRLIPFVAKTKWRRYYLRRTQATSRHRTHYHQISIAPSLCHWPLQIFFMHAVILYSFRVKVTHRQFVCWCRHPRSFFLHTLNHSFASFNVNETVCSVVHTVKGARFFSIDNNMRSLFTLELSLSSEPAYAYKKFTLGCERMRSSGKSERRRLSR